MDIETIKLVLQGANILGTVALYFWLRVEKSNDKTNERVSELAEKVEAMDKDLSRLEVASKAAPNHSDLGEVYKAINGLSETVNQLVGENRGQSDTLRLILNQITQKGMQ